MKTLVAVCTVVVCLSAPRVCRAQSATSGPAADGPRLALDQDTIRRAIAATSIDLSAAGQASVAAGQAAGGDWAADGRACEGCPRRRAWAAYFQSALINVAYNLGNKARGEETAKVGFTSWGRNLKYGFEWDDNPFSTNQFGHPYQGSNYYTAGRANGLSYWESAAVAAFGSATWEYFGENNYASFNDLVNTTLGGIALGEMFHRVAWLIRDTEASGGTRTRQEILATVFDPLGGANRFLSGDASRISKKPETYVPSTKDTVGSFGALWQGDSSNQFQGSAKMFLEMDLWYGDMWSGRSRSPFEAFTASLRLGGGKGLSDVRVRGRLIGQPLGSTKKVQFTLAQSYDYVSNRAYEFGRQGFDLTFSSARKATSSLGALFLGGVGITPLGAVNRVSPSAFRDPMADPEQAGRDYDYGPGTTFGGGVQLFHNGRVFANASYQGYQLYVVDGVRANHVMQRVRLDLLVPVHGRLGAGVTGEFFYRKTYFQTGEEERLKFPQVRVYLAWRPRALTPAAAAVMGSSSPSGQTEHRSWITAGGGFTTLKGDCATCEDPVYRHTGSVLANIGFRGNSRLDGGAELFWVPAHTAAGEAIRSTFVLGVGQYRPLVGRGLFVKGGMGIAFVRNWIYDATNDTTPPFTTNAMALVYGAGWEFRTRSRVGLQIFGTHHIVALGDLKRSDSTTVENVLGNFWTIGASIVVR